MCFKICANKLVRLKIIIIVLFLLACKNEKEIKVIASGEDSNLPIYFGAKNVKYYTLQDSLKGVMYELKLPYPGASEVVLEYYDAKMKQAGFEPYVEEYYAKGSRKWQEFIDGTIKGEPEVAQLKASWADKRHTRRSNLNLKYYWYIEDKKSPYIVPSNDNLHVDFQLMPFFEWPPPSDITVPDKK
ncbi:MAG: hypothetical protein FD156_2568 [Nitrospirae bacterium]|nr:MAG: hypothetical protein FD156_2568 [Nitrospirota bacterium]